MAIPKDYLPRVYAGVLGKIIGVYLGHPHKPLLVVTDDDISGTFTFLRALPDYGNTLELTTRLCAFQ